MGRDDGVKVTKKLKDEDEPEMRVKLTGHTKPKFAHNASQAGKEPVWSYEFWKTSAPDNKGEFDITMELSKMKNANENKQSELMNDAAIAFVEGQYPKFKGKVKLTSR